MARKRERTTPPLWPWLLVASALGIGIYLIRFGPTFDVSGISTMLTPVEADTAGIMAGRDAAATVMLSALSPVDTSVAPSSTVRLAVQAVRDSGEPLADVAVRFAVPDISGGALLTEEAWTDSNGSASTTLIMPAQPEEVVVDASLAGMDGIVARFTVRGREIVRQQMEYVAGDGQEAEPGTLLPRPYVIEVRDADGRPQPGVEVRFQVVTGGGLAVPSTVHTDPLGRASAMWTLGENPGFQTMAATSELVEAPVTFTAIAAAPPPVADPPSVTGSSAVAGSTPAPPAPAPESGRSAFADMVSPGEEVRPLTVVRKEFTIGGSSICAIRETRVTCRGSGDRGQLIVDALPGSRSVTAGLFHACALDPSGVARCWGANDAGQLGDGTRFDRDTPTLVATELRFSTLSAGVSHTCGLTRDGTIACWGQNLGGQLGNGSRDNRTTPAQGGGPAFETLAAGWNHTCGMTAIGNVYCWGLNRSGQVGDGSTLDRLAPEWSINSVQALAAGGSHSCVISDGDALCWGENGTGQLGDGTTTSRVLPTPVNDLPAVPQAVVAGAAHSCVLSTGGAVWCWGQNVHGQLGNGTTTNASRPVRVLGDIVFDEIWAGGAVTCGIAIDGGEYCWGMNQSGQLGDGTVTNRAVPTRSARD